MFTGGAMLILEKILDPDCAGPELCLIYDIRMRLMDNQGKQRTLDEYKAFLGKNGFDQEKIQVYINREYSCYDAMLCKKI